jgi:hypothetical protein
LVVLCFIHLEKNAQYNLGSKSHTKADAATKKRLEDYMNIFKGTSKTRTNCTDR